MSWPAAVLWVLMIAAAVSRGPGLLYLLMITGAFGSLQMLPFSGGVNLLPQSACAALFVCKALIHRGNIVRGLESALDPQRMILFSAFVGYAVFGALVLPRAFLGLFEVVPISAPISGTDILRPASGNFTQILPHHTVLRDGADLSVDRRVGAGADPLPAGTPLGRLRSRHHRACRPHHLRPPYRGVLEPFRTATYSFLVDVEAEGSKRVVGLMPEASTFGTACVGLMGSLVFLRSSSRSGLEQILCSWPSLLGAMTIPLDLLRWRRAGPDRFVFVRTASNSSIGCSMHEMRGGISSTGVPRPRFPWPPFVTFHGDRPVADCSIPSTRWSTAVFEKTKSASYAERTMWTEDRLARLPRHRGTGAGLARSASRTGPCRSSEHRPVRRDADVRLHRRGTADDVRASKELAVFATG